MHLAGVLVLVFVPCCISQAVNETAQDRVRIIEGEVKSMDSRLSNDIKTLKGVNDVEMDDSGSKVWINFGSVPMWCTIPGRSLIAHSVESPYECHKLCQGISGCNAVEYWVKFEKGCYECKETSLARPYTDTRDLSYPPYVWVFE